MPPKRVSLNSRAPEASAAPAVPTPSSEASALWRTETARQEILDLDLNQIMPRAEQPRTIFDAAQLAELAASIREHGVIQPIIVRPIPLTKWEGYARRYEIIAGERRWRASMLAERTTIPALVRQDTTDHATLLELALVENLQRADLHPLEEASAFGTMRDQLGYSIRRVAERVGRSKGYVENRLKLLDLAPDLQQLVSERPDTLTHMGELEKVSDPTQRAALVAAVRDGLSYAETQARVRQILAPPPEQYPDLSLRKDSDDRQPDADHANAADVRVSLRKDSNNRSHHDDAAVSGRPDTDQRHHDADHADSVSLTATERTTLVAIDRKVSAWVAAPERLNGDDRELLAGLARRLAALLQRES